jgi:hypothetical protein
MSSTPVPYRQPELETRSLDDLAAEANREHEGAVRAMGEFVARAIRAGSVLLEIRERVPRGQWATWVAENFGGSRWTADFYIRCGRHRSELEAAGTMNYAEVRAFVGTLTAAKRHVDPEADLARRQRARELADGGASQAAIGREFDVDGTTIRRWLDPGCWRPADRASPVGMVPLLDEFNALVERAAALADEMNKPTWVKVLNALVRQNRKAANQCVCTEPLAEGGDCIRCGKTLPES